MGSLVRFTDKTQRFLSVSRLHAKGRRIFLLFSSIMGEELVWACKNGDLDQVKVIADKPGFDVNAEILGGRNGLHFAADYGQKDVIVFLLSKGAKVNLPDKHGITALLASIYESKTECVKLLLEKGADKDLKAPDGSSYLDCAETDEIKSLLK